MTCKKPFHFCLAQWLFVLKHLRELSDVWVVRHVGLEMSVAAPYDIVSMWGIFHDTVVDIPHGHRIIWDGGDFVLLGDRCRLRVLDVVYNYTRSPVFSSLRPTNHWMFEARFERSVTRRQHRVAPPKINQTAHFQLIMRRLAKLHVDQNVNKTRSKWRKNVAETQS